MTLFDNLQSLIDTLPAALQEKTAFDLKEFEQALTHYEITLPDHPQLETSLARVFAGSEMISKSCIQKPAILLDLINSGNLFSAYNAEFFKQALTAKTVNSDTELMSMLRQFRNREMFRIAWRDQAGWAELDETLNELSWLADACIQYALDYLYEAACSLRGTPCLQDGTPQQLIVLGMGKLGANELNFSSDIDLIFAYADEGVLSDRKETTYSEFFTQLCRKLITVLDEITLDGFVFRTDIRLRPYGESGPVVMNFVGLEEYYLTQAREWERYALIKARQVAGDPTTGPQLMAMLHPFVYRRYLDYGAFEELRNMKFMINQDLQRKDRLQNIKLGPGGIREVEFIGQAFQLIRGGQEPALQQRGIVAIIKQLSNLGLLEKDAAEDLIHAYRFLRRAENHIQEYRDQQTHDLPHETQLQESLAFSMGYQNWPDFFAELNIVREQVRTAFGNVFSMTEQETDNQDGLSVWVGEADPAILIGHLMKLGYTNPDQVLDDVANFKKSTALKHITAKGSTVLDRLLPHILETLPELKQPELTLKRVLGLLEAVAGRNVYLALLSENPGALKQLLTLSSASPWICQNLSLYPVLFDELLDTRSLYTPLDGPELQQKLQDFIKRNKTKDEEQLMFVLRKFKHINVLRVAAADIMGKIPLTVVSDYLTYIAEALLQQVVLHAWNLITEKYGKPDDQTEPLSGFGLLGFGKLGGRELGYGSDLDMVFLYNCQDGNGMTNGKKAISNTQFYIRLGQKIMHILQTNLLSGILYEADMRLRPSGNSGLLVTHINTYEDYFRNEAWTWEHQALVRARFITGDPQLKGNFERIRQTILCLPRNPDTLKQEVREMREKMRDNLAVKEVEKFDLKQSKGGIADIEFIVQFNILARSAEQPLLTTHTENIRLLDALQTHGYLSETVAQTLKEAYISYRNRGHREALQGNRNIVDAAEYEQTRQQVSAIWNDFME